MGTEGQEALSKRSQLETKDLGRNDNEFKFMPGLLGKVEFDFNVSFTKLGPGVTG